MNKRCSKLLKRHYKTFKSVSAKFPRLANALKKAKDLLTHKRHLVTGIRYQHLKTWLEKLRELVFARKQVTPPAQPQYTGPTRRPLNTDATPHPHIAPQPHNEPAIEPIPHTVQSAITHAPQILDTHKITEYSTHASALWRARYKKVQAFKQELLTTRMDQDRFEFITKYWMFLYHFNEIKHWGLKLRNDKLYQPNTTSVEPTTPPHRIRNSATTTNVRPKQ